MPKYFIYARKSTDDEERQQLSIPAQIDELRTFSQKENLEVIDTLIESKTAKKPGRKLFNEMLSRIEAGEADGIISWHPDRLARNAVDAGRIIYLLDTKKLIDLKFTTVMFQNNPNGLFMLAIAFGQSKYYVDSLSENTKRGLRQKIRLGYYPCEAPLGYLNDKATKTIVVNPNIAPIVKEAFNLYSTGNYPLKTISAFFASKGIESRHHTRIKIDTIKRILTNPFYYGYFRYNGELFPGKHKPLITKEFFDQLQSVVKKRGFVRPETSYNYPFAGLMKCGYCGYKITAETKTKFYKGTNRTARYTYYRCTRKSKTIDCREPFIRQDELAGQLNELIKKHSLPDEWGKDFYQRIDEEEKTITQSLIESSQVIKLKLAGIKSQLDSLLTNYLDKTIDRDDYLDRKNILVGQRKTLEEQLANLPKSQIAWLGPFRDWVKTGLEAKNVADPTTDYYSKREFMLKTGSDFRLKDKKAYFLSGKHPAALGAAATGSDLVRPGGIGPPVYCLEGSRFIR